MITIIANEKAGSRAGMDALRRVTEWMQAEKIPFSMQITAGPGHATELADQAIRQGANEIVCLGGDGTICEIVNGIAGRDATLYFVPCGTGNDFAKMLHLPNDPVQALKAQLEGIPLQADVGRLNRRYFMNVSGSGFDVEVLKQAARFKHLGRGKLPYLMGIFAALRHFRPLDVEITYEDGKTEKKAVTIFSVGNGSYIGGGMKAVPHAEIGDGLFDVVIADGMSQKAILRLLSRFISGRHVEMPMVREFRCRELTIRCPGMTVDLDGELIPMDVARYAILPGAVEVRMPR